MGREKPVLLFEGGLKGPLFFMPYSCINKFHLNGSIASDHNMAECSTAKPMYFPRCNRNESRQQRLLCAAPGHDSHCNSYVNYGMGRLYPVRISIVKINASEKVKVRQSVEHASRRQLPKATLANDERNGMT